MSQINHSNESQIKVCQTNPQSGGGTKSVIRVYLDNRMIAEEYVSRRSPLSYLKSLKKSKHIDSLAIQLSISGLTLADIGLSEPMDWPTDPRLDNSGGML